jgi:hypothetical protein
MNYFSGNTTNSSVTSPPTPSTPSGQSDTPWLISTAAKSVGTLAGLFSIAIGFFSLFSIFDTSCILAGGLLMIEGLLMALLEAPCFCSFLDFAYMPSTFFDQKPNWLKATLYLFFAVIPFIWCTGITTFFACGLIFVTCALYLLMALGKKANADEMRTKASNLSLSPSAVLVNNEELPKPTNPPAYAKEAPTANMYVTQPKPIYSTQGPVY